MGSYTYVRMIPLPSAVRAVTLPNDDGSFDVYINSNIPAELQVKALEHELEHIHLGHFYNDDSVGVNELEAG